VAAAFAAGRVTAEQVTVIAPITRPENLAAAAEHGVDLAAVEETLAAVAATRPHSELAQVLHHFLERLDPDGTEPDPTEGRSLSLAKHADGSVSGRFELDAVGREKVQRCSSPWCRPAGRGPPAAAPSNSATPWCSGPTTPSPPATCPSCAPSSRTWSR
jgi:hypothetical protein